MLSHILPPICSLEPFRAPFLDFQRRPIWKPLWPQIQILANNLLSDDQQRTRPQCANIFMYRPSTGRVVRRVAGFHHQFNRIEHNVHRGGNQLVIHGSKNLCSDNHVVQSRVAVFKDLILMSAPSDAKTKGFSNDYRFTMQLSSDSLRLPGHSSDYYGSHLSVLYSHSL